MHECHSRTRKAAQHGTARHDEGIEIAQRNAEGKSRTQDTMYRSLRNRKKTHVQGVDAKNQIDGTGWEGIE